jgi:hypothetical protein
MIGFMIFLVVIHFVPRGISSIGIHTSENGDFSFTGDYEGDLSIMYFHEEWNFTQWTNANSSTNIRPHNVTFFDNEYNVRSLEIRAGNLYNYSGTGYFSIAENTSSQINLTSSYRFAQEFTAPELCKINQIMLYLNFSTLIDRYYDIFIYDELLQEQIGVGYSSLDTRPTVDEWITIFPSSNVLEPGLKYNLVLMVWALPGGYNTTFNYWKAENYTNPSFNKGITRRFNGINWIQIPNDNMVDMMCNFSYTKFIDPAEIDLKFTINDELLIPTYQITPWGFEGYEAFTSFTFDSPQFNDINITITANQTIPTLDIEIVVYYFMEISAIGSYTADEDKIEWTVIYPYEEIAFGWPPPIFLFEEDWVFKNFSDPDGFKIDDVYFGPITHYNESYYGITIFFGPPLEDGNYTGIFHSPSYCNSIITKVKKGSDFVSIPSVELGKTIILEAEIANPLKEPVSGGIGQIWLYSSSGELIYNESGLSSINGTMTSSEISTSSGFKEGTYETKIFWTNGREIAIYTINVIIEEPIDILFWVILSIGLALAVTPVALLTYKYVRQRNWEKSLKNLFVLTKDGLSIYEYSFGIEIQDPALISAMISALTNFVREATGSKKALRTVDQEDKKVILNHGNYTTIALMSEKDLPIIHKRVKKFTAAFEDQFGLNLKQWSGETTIFKEADVIVNKHFPINVEDQIIRGVRGKLVEFRNRLEIMEYPQEIISLMREITEFISRYRGIVNKYYIDYYFEIIKIAEEKIIST